MLVSTLFLGEGGIRMEEVFFSDVARTVFILLTAGPALGGILLLYWKGRKCARYLLLGSLWTFIAGLLLLEHTPVQADRAIFFATFIPPVLGLIGLIALLTLQVADDPGNS